MRSAIRYPTIFGAITIVLAIGGVSAGDDRDHDHRAHGTHVHGIAQLNLALEGSEIHAELNSPAANVVGFEHAPSSEADHAALDRAVAALKDGNRLFIFNGEAGCRIEGVEIASSLIREDDAHEQGHEEKADHAHEEHGETHSEISAVYRFECANPANLERLRVEMFETFPGTERLKVQFVVGDKQGAAELTPSDHVVNF